MAIKKSDLYASIWASCDELRGGMDASQYKDFVLFMLFIKYISDKYANSDAHSPLVVIPTGASFTDLIALKGKSDIGDRINTQIIQPLIDANDRLARTDFPDFNDPNKLGEGQAMVERLTNLIGIFQKPELDFSQNRADHDDLLGDAYEYLMRHFATESGKSKGQFYTPSEVSRVMARVLGISSANAKASTTAYDPTCGSGSLLLKVAAEAGTRITLEGQEMDVATAGLARMNMILHDFPTANIQQGNTLAAPKFKDEEQLRTYDYVVANPPFSVKTWSVGLSPERDPYQRFAWGVPPARKGDYAFLLHIIRSLKSNGKGACILPHGVLFRGNAEAVIRKQLVVSGILKGVIGLPANLFYGTGIPACILVLDKENAAARKGVFMIDASKGFLKDGAKNRLREQDIHRIVDTFARQAEVPGYARMVPVAEIGDPKNDHNLNLPRYIDSAEPEDLHDIEGHMRGGIPERDLDVLDAYWMVLPSVREMLFESAGRAGYARLGLSLTEVKAKVLGHAEFMAFQEQATKTFADWSSKAQAKLVAFGKGGHPKALIEAIAEELLTAFRPVPLLDAYDVYQHLMNYWAETMQDDCYLIADGGWFAVPGAIYQTDKKGKRKQNGWGCDLIPKSLIVETYFSPEQAALNAKQDQLEAATESLVELIAEHGGEDGVLRDLDSKADAKKAYDDALLEIWNDNAKPQCDEYVALLTEVEDHHRELERLSAETALRNLRNERGSITLKAVKSQLAATVVLSERALLSGYLDEIESLKRKQKVATALLAATEKRYLAELAVDSDLKKYENLKIAVSCLNLLDRIAELKREFKALDTALDERAFKKYATLTAAEIRTIVVEHKWMPSVSTTVQGELDRVSQSLTTRVRELAERYATPLPEITADVERLTVNVAEHLAKMGASWK
jgi:type I restriction enzyme M protein